MDIPKTMSASETVMKTDQQPLEDLAEIHAGESKTPIRETPNK